MMETNAAKTSLLGGELSRFVPRRVTGPVVAGVAPGQSAAVVQRAAELASTLKVKLICAYVDITTYLSDEPEEQHGGAGEGDDPEGVSAGIRRWLQDFLGDADLRWTFLTLSGNPARALAQLAESANASVIAVGTREPALRTKLEHLVVGSVAVQLTHCQRRPVLVVPIPKAKQ